MRLAAVRGIRMAGQPRHLPRIDNVYTRAHIHAMNKPFADPKGSINLRIEAQTRALIDAAAASLGKTRTEFMVDSARTQAIDVLLDQRMFVLDGDQFNSFVAALDNSAPPGPKLTKLMQRKPAWEN